MIGKVYLKLIEAFYYELDHQRLLCLLSYSSIAFCWATKEGLLHSFSNVYELFLLVLLEPPILCMIAI
jgi:hypothetical protein